jgi:hypothetical protein
MALELLQDGEEFSVADDKLTNVTDGDPEVVYRLRKLDPKRHKSIIKQHTKAEFQRGVGKVDKTDWPAVSDDVIDYVLIGWQGVLLGGKPAECSRELKLKGLDTPRRIALADLATTNTRVAEEVRAESFRPAPASV